MPKICINTRILNQPLTGVQRYTLELLSRFENRIDCLSPTSELSGLRGHAWEQLALPKLVRGRLLWSPSNTGPLAVERQVVTIHDLAPLDHPEWFNPRFAAWYGFLIPRLVRRVGRVITISEFTKSRILETTGIAEDKVIVIPNGVNARFSPRQPEEVETARKALNISTPYYVLNLGTLAPSKNVKRVLEAWRCICDRLPPEVWLVVAGIRGKRLVCQGVDFGSLPPRVYFTGHVPDDHLPALYSGALAFVYVSLYEGFGLPLLEAMAAGTPMYS